jgi:uncharacterized membrane protein YhaH (DUF805 family)
MEYLDSKRQPHFLQTHGGKPMPIWLSRIFGREGRISKLYDPERFTRIDFLIIVLCIAFMILLAGDFSLQLLAIVSGCVIVIGCLVYTPTPILLLIGLCVTIGAFAYFANRMRDWQAIGIMVLCATVWLEYVIERMGGVILRRVEEAHTKLDSLQERMKRVEAKQDASSYVSPIDL